MGGRREGEEKVGEGEGRREREGGWSVKINREYGKKLKCSVIQVEELNLLKLCRYMYMYIDRSLQQSQTFVSEYLSTM